jgi:hypothetical protein
MHLLRDALLDPESYLHNSPPMAPARSLAPGEMKVDAKTVMAYAAQEAAAKRAQLPLQPPPPSMAGQAQAKTLMHDPSMVPPRIGHTGAVPAAPPEMTVPAMPKMNTMRIATPVGYSSRPPRKMWPIVLVLALLLGLGGGAFAVAWFGRCTARLGRFDATSTGPGRLNAQRCTRPWSWMPTVRGSAVPCSRRPNSCDPAQYIATRICSPSKPCFSARRSGRARYP